MSKRKVYVFALRSPGGGGDVLGQAVSDDGYLLAEHVSSGRGWSQHDMGVTSDWKHDDYDKHFGEGNWELEWVDYPDTHEGLKVAGETAKQRRAAKSPPSENAHTNKGEG